MSKYVVAFHVGRKPPFDELTVLAVDSRQAVKIARANVDHTNLPTNVAVLVTTRKVA